MEGLGRRVLVVEDNAAMRDLVQQVLEGAGYAVVLAASAGEAEEAWDRHGGGEGIDLLLTDLVLPDRPGTELAEQLAAADARLRVLVMSGYDDHELLSRDGAWRARGGAIRKPFDIGELTGRVAELLS